jgi:hypothetical protein
MLEAPVLSAASGPRDPARARAGHGVHVIHTYTGVRAYTLPSESVTHSCQHGDLELQFSTPADRW